VVQDWSFLRGRHKKGSGVDLVKLETKPDGKGGNVGLEFSKANWYTFLNFPTIGEYPRLRDKVLEKVFCQHCSAGEETREFDSSMRGKAGDRGHDKGRYGGSCTLRGRVYRSAGGTRGRLPPCSACRDFKAFPEIRSTQGQGRHCFVMWSKVSLVIYTYTILTRSSRA
jgi:hypothetical protein